MRVVWNLVENIDVERQSFKQAFRLIEELSFNKDSILTYLGNVTIDCIKSCYRKAKNSYKKKLINHVRLLIIVSLVLPIGMLTFAENG